MSRDAHIRQALLTNAGMGTDTLPGWLVLLFLLARWPSIEPLEPVTLTESERTAAVLRAEGEGQVLWYFPRYRTASTWLAPF